MKYVCGTKIRLLTLTIFEDFNTVFYIHYIVVNHCFITSKLIQQTQTKTITPSPCNFKLVTRLPPPHLVDNPLPVSVNQYLIQSPRSHLNL